MTVETRITAREFNRDVSAAKRAAVAGPVTITDHGRPSHVLLSVDDYERLVGAHRRVGDALRMDGDGRDDLDLPRRESSLRVPDL